MTQKYCEGASKSGLEFKAIALHSLKFDINLHKGYRAIQKLEPDLVMAQEHIQWCHHLVLIFPIWWGTMPALLKGFFDRVFLPGFAFKYHKNDPFWDKLLAGRSAHAIVTSDAPYLYNVFAYWYAPYRVIKKTILWFCGFKPVKLTAFGSIKNRKPEELKKILTKVFELGRSGI